MNHSAARIILNERTFTLVEFVEFQCVEDWLMPIQHMVSFALNNDPHYTFYTSGSTGNPKPITHSRNVLVSSAVATLEYFSLAPGQRVLLALPAQYIGGAMMVLRACLGGLELVLQQPSGCPQIPNDIDFLPLTPAQYMAVDRAQGWKDFRGTVLLGGSAVPGSYDVPVDNFSVFIGYGMTETASHVALRRIGDTVYQGVGSTRFSVDDQNQLILSAPHLGIEKLATEDLVEIIGPTTFKYLGRSGWVINSGGVKIHPTQWESRLQKQGIAAFVVPFPDDHFGHIPILVALKKEHLSGWSLVKKDWSGIRPKRAVLITEVPTVAQGKVDRSALEAWVKSHPDRLFPLE
ncbi:MAG: AMP-binding protein [Schleiferiaceae bacterium]